MKSWGHGVMNNRNKTLVLLLFFMTHDFMTHDLYSPIHMHPLTIDTHCDILYTTAKKEDRDLKRLSTRDHQW